MQNQNERWRVFLKDVLSNGWKKRGATIPSGRCFQEPGLRHRKAQLGRASSGGGYSACRDLALTYRVACRRLNDASDGHPGMSHCPSVYSGASLFDTLPPLIASHCLSLPLAISRCLSLPLAASHCLSLPLTISYCLKICPELQWSMLWDGRLVTNPNPNPNGWC